MNLVISGPIDDTLRNLVVALSHPRRVVSLHARADRLEGVDDGTGVKLQVAALCDAARVDHAYIEEGIRFADFKLLAMDMDSTLITIECIDEIADFAGKKKEVAAITEAAMRGEITDFAESLRRRVALLAGTDVKVLSCVFETRLKITPGAISLVERAKANNIRLALISGGFDYFSNRLKDVLNLDVAYANMLDIKDNKLTGLLSAEILDAMRKATLLQELMHHFNIMPHQTIVIGDGANDIKMMYAANFSVAFHAKPITEKAATHKIRYGGLDIINDWLT